MGIRRYPGWSQRLTPTAVYHPVLPPPGLSCVSGGALRIAPLLGLPQVTGNSAFEEPIVNESVGNATYNGLQSVFHKRFSQ